MKRYDLVIMIGRFQPFHIGHQKTIQRALELGDKAMVIIGSANQPRTIKNPWTAQERAIMLSCDLSRDDQKRLIVKAVSDQMPNNQKWATNVQQQVDEVLRGWSDKPKRIGLIGYKKDESSYYLDMFPQWEFIETDHIEMINASDIRKNYFTQPLLFTKAVVPAKVFNFLEEFRKTSEYDRLYLEWLVIENYKKSWEAAPYPPTFVTADAVVIQSGHVLLITRKKGALGGGLKALPGGFVNQKEQIVDAMVRELREETRLKVPAPVIKGNIKAKEVFDHPDRSLRGRTVTHAFLVELPAGPLPVVKGSDDADDARWIPISRVCEDEMFEDHYQIIQHFLGRI